jgi:hypothetical protein
MAEATNKTQMTEASVWEFLNTVADEQQRADSLKVVEIFERATGEEPKMWGAVIVGFGLRHLKYESGREMDWMLAGFSPRKGNITLYITGGFPKYDELTAKLGKYKRKGGCLHIKKLSDIDETALTDIIKASVEHINAGK